MIMSLNIKKVFFLCIVASAMASCVNEDITPDESLTNTLFTEASAETELGREINALLQKYGSAVSYQFSSDQLYFSWTSRTQYWYRPVPNGCEDQIIKVVRFIRENAFSDYPDVLVKAYLPSRILLVDSICNQSTYRARSLVDVLVLPAHGIAISNVSPRMANWTDSNWNKLKSSLVNSMLSEIYSNNSAALADFMAEKYTTWYYLYEESNGPYGSPADPLGEYSVIQYHLYDRGFASSVITYTSSGMGATNIPNNQQDLGFFLQFMFNTPASEQKHVYNRFPRMKRRAYLLAVFIRDILNLDAIEMQNANNPNDKLEAGFYDTLND